MIQDMKVFIADIDGTLICKGEAMLPRTRAALQRLHEEGVLVGIASGRPLDYRILDKAKEWDLGFDFDLALGMNGGDVYDRFHEGISHNHLLKKELIRKILTFLDGEDVNAIVYENGYDQISCLRMDEFMEGSIKRNHSHVEVGDIDRLSRYDTGKLEVHYFPENEEHILKVIADNADPAWNCVKTFTGTVEFMDPDLNKGAGLRHFCELNGYDLANVIGFGDMQNDIELVRTAGWGVAMLNGCDETKAAADDITEYPVEEDGLGRYLEDHWFNR